jgi:hypothetical protein
MPFDHNIVHHYKCDGREHYLISPTLHVVLVRGAHDVGVMLPRVFCYRDRMGDDWAHDVEVDPNHDSSLEGAIEESTNTIGERGFETLVSMFRVSATNKFVMRVSRPG